MKIIPQKLKALFASKFFRRGVENLDGNPSTEQTSLKTDMNRSMTAIMDLLDHDYDHMVDVSARIRLTTYLIDFLENAPAFRWLLRGPFAHR